MSPEGLGNTGEEYSLTERIRDSLIAAAPEHGDLITGRDAVVTAYCAERGITKDEISIDQLLEIRALPEWQDPFTVPPSQE